MDEPFDDVVLRQATKCYILLSITTGASETNIPTTDYDHGNVDTSNLKRSQSMYVEEIGHSDPPSIFK